MDPQSWLNSPTLRTFLKQNHSLPSALQERESQRHILRCYILSQSVPERLLLGLLPSTVKQHALPTCLNFALPMFVFQMTNLPEGTTMKSLSFLSIKGTQVHQVSGNFPTLCFTPRLTLYTISCTFCTLHLQIVTPIPSPMMENTHLQGALKH